MREAGAGLVLMHMLGDPKTMQDDPRYDDVVVGGARLPRCSRSGQPSPPECLATASASTRGSGSARPSSTTSRCSRAIAAFEQLRTPVLVGASRKRFIGELTGVDDPAERVEGTAGTVAWCAANGVDVVRVHDVRAMTRVVRVVDAIARGTAS